MLSHLILIVLTAGPGQGEPAGQVSSTAGTLTLRRGESTYSAKPGATVLVGDSLETGDAGDAKVLIDDEHVVTLGPGSSAVLQGPSGRRVLTLGRGEVRVTAGDTGPMTVAIGNARAEVRHGILRASVDGSRFRVERGHAEIRAANRPPSRLEVGREIQATAGRPVLVSSGSRGWTIRDDLPVANPADDGRLALAMQAVGIGAEKPPAVKPATVRPDPKPGINSKPGAPATPGSPIRRPDEPKPPNPNGPEIPPPPDDTETTRSGPVPPPPADEANRAITGQPVDTDNPDNPTNRPYQPIAVAQPVSLSSVSLALGSVSSSSSAASSGALFSDAQQDSVNLMFPGNVHIVTAQSQYQLFNVRLTPRDMFPIASQFWSIGVGPSPTTLVSTTVRTGSALNPTVLRIPRTDAYLVNLAQYGIKDPTTITSTDSSNNAVGITGFLGQNPTAPQIRGATPLLDARAQFNQRLTFAVGELALSTAASKTGTSNNPVLSIRRSDQDRQIIKSPTGNDNLDKVTPNPDVNFTQVHDAKFFPEIPLVYVPAGSPTQALRNPPTYHGLDLLRKAAATTLLADSLFAYSQRTGQTRFVVDKQVVDISGYRKAGTSLMRSGHAAPGMSGGPVKAVHHQTSAAHHRGK